MGEELHFEGYNKTVFTAVREPWAYNLKLPWPSCCN